jgi:hypothetical protein
VPYNELIVTTDDRNNAQYRAAAELSPNGASAIASEMHRLDDASTLVAVLEWLLDAARRVAGDAQLFIVRGSALRAWRGAQAEPASLSGQRFPLNVGGRVVAILLASPRDEATAATLDILAAYASRSLESMTLHKALGLVPPRLQKMSSELIYR